MNAHFSIKHPLDIHMYICKIYIFKYLNLLRFIIIGAVYNEVHWSKT